MNPLHTWHCRWVWSKDPTWSSHWNCMPPYPLLYPGIHLSLPCHLIRVTVHLLRLWIGFMEYSNRNHILFAKFCWPGNNKGTDRSSIQAATCSLVYHTLWKFHTVFFHCWTSSKEAVNANFSLFEFDPPRNGTRVHRFSSRSSIHSITDRFNSN